jgi:hypothetical protein
VQRHRAAEWSKDGARMFRTTNVTCA